MRIAEETPRDPKQTVPAGKPGAERRTSQRRRLAGMKEENDRQAKAADRPAGTTIRWINVDVACILTSSIACEGAYQFHPLAAEDVLRKPQRPKMENQEGHLFIVARMLMWKDERLHHERWCVFCSRRRC
ncbi:MAG: hypothetical protein Q8J74_06950 [Candidatus Didemnitutus sp.]|nr:hypothetical protein [Candidatus Didemnitutus sp.]